jgi:hypothetical protein
MPDEKEKTEPDEETIPSTPLHAHGEGREEDIEGEIGGGQGEDRDAESAENTGGSTSGGPGGAAVGEDDPSNVIGDSDD